MQRWQRWAGLLGGPCAALLLASVITHPVPAAAPSSIAAAAAAETAAAVTAAADATTWVGTAPTLPFRVHTELVLGVSYPGTAPSAPPAPGVAAHPAGITPLALTLPGAVGALGVPVVALDAYRAAAARLAVDDAACHLPWSLLAGIGRIESGHARGGRVDATGRTGSPIVGPVLDGSAGNAAIGDSDGGRFDGDPVWDRAVGPMQFIPTTWARWGADGNGDGVADPSNIGDAALAAARYLCSYGRDLSTDAGARVAVLGYNHSEAYVSEVLAWAHAYALGVVPEEVPAVAPQASTPASTPAATSTVAAATTSPRPVPSAPPGTVTSTQLPSTPPTRATRATPPPSAARPPTGTSASPTPTPSVAPPAAAPSLTAPTLTAPAAPSTSAPTRAG